MLQRSTYRRQNSSKMGQGNERDEAASNEDDFVRVFRKRKMEESRPMYAMEFLNAIL